MFCFAPRHEAAEQAATPVRLAVPRLGMGETDAEDNLLVKSRVFVVVWKNSVPTAKIRTRGLQRITFCPLPGWKMGDVIEHVL